MSFKFALRTEPLYYFKLLILLLLLGDVAPVFAQRTVVQDSGGGQKIELHYNAANQVVETDTIGADGKLLQKDVLEYPPGALVAQTVSTSYWPNGKVHKVTRDTYDNNSNFTGEFIEVFDEAGKQASGYKLNHDPHTNVYTCAAWQATTLQYKAEECPAGEESSGAPETAKKFTADDVTQQLTAARQAAQQPPRSTPPPGAPQTTAGTNVKEVGLIFPANIHTGERVSGSVVDDPGDYEDSPEVVVTRVALPFSAAGNASTLSGWHVELEGEPPQSADGPIALTVPPGQIELAVVFRQNDNAGTPVSMVVKLPLASRTKSKPLSSYLAPAVCVKGQLCVVRGQFNGNSSKTFAAFEERAAKIVAETSGAAYLAIPEATDAGPRPLVLAEGTKAIGFPMVIAKFSIRPSRRDLPKGETLLMYPTVEGPGDLPDSEWRPGNFPPSNLELARKVLPGFQPVHEGSKHEQREAEEKRASTKSGEKPGDEAEENEGGEILLVIKNLTPDDAAFRESKNGMYVFRLHAASFRTGDFKYKFNVEATKTGSFGVRAWLIPFLAPVAGQEFPIADAGSAK